MPDAVAMARRIVSDRDVQGAVGGIGPGQQPVQCVIGIIGDDGAGVDLLRQIPGAVEFVGGGEGVGIGNLRRVSQSVIGEGRDIAARVGHGQRAVVAVIADAGRA